MSFFLRRLTDPALTEVFSDHRDLIARGKHFLAITSAPVLARWVFPSARRWQEQPLTAHSRPRARAATARLAQALPDGCCLQWCPCLLRALGGPGEAGSPRPPSAWRRLPGKPSVAGGPWRPPTPLCRTGFSLGESQRCSFHFRAAGEAAYGHLKGINDA